jgi:glycerate kinase
MVSPDGNIAVSRPLARPGQSSVWRVLAAPDKFRGTASAVEVARAVSEAADAVGMVSRALPLADGGEGLIDVFGGPTDYTDVTGPLGEPVRAGWRLGPDGRAVIECALASGLLLAGGASHNDPVAATSRGTGELIATAIDRGATRMLVGVGGSASTDGGRGAVQALGGLVPLGGAGLGIEVLVCCDVTTTYLDAARIFGPQKGATPGQVAELTARLSRQADWLRSRFGRDVRDLPGSGAAGGLAGGLAALGARLVSGFGQVATELRLSEALADTDLVVTGEGKLDDQSFQGKVIGGLVELARCAGVPVFVVAGTIETTVPSDITAISMTERFGAERSVSDPLGCVRDIVTEHLTASK